MIPDWLWFSVLTGVILIAILGVIWGRRKP